MKQMRALRNILLAACISLVSLSLGAQAPKALEGAVRAAAMERILQANDIRTTLELDFEMKRHSALLTEPLVSRGKAAFSFPDKVRWEVTSPRPSVFVLDGSTETDRRRQSLLRSVGKVSEKGLINEEDFDVTIYAAGKQWQVDLKPLRRDLGQMFTLITLMLDSASGQLRSIVLTDTGGDLTEIVLSGMTKGRTLDPGLFAKP